jgi:hypothetical protein
MISKLSVALAATCALLVGGNVAANASPVPYVVTIEQVGANVVATGTGEFDLTGLTFVPAVPPFPAFVNPSAAAIAINTTLAADTYRGTFMGPTNFGPGTGGAASTKSGDYVFFDPTFYLQLPTGYTAGTTLNGEDTFNNTTIAMLGITPGTYTWTWGTAADQSFTVDVVPVPAAFPLFATGLGGLGLLGWRRKRKAQATP